MAICKDTRVAWGTGLGNDLSGDGGSCGNTHFLWVTRGQKAWVCPKWGSGRFPFKLSLQCYFCLVCFSCCASGSKPQVFRNLAFTEPRNTCDRTQLKGGMSLGAPIPSPRPTAGGAMLQGSLCFWWRRNAAERAGKGWGRQVWNEPGTLSAICLLGSSGLHLSLPPKSKYISSFGPTVVSMILPS